MANGVKILLQAPDADRLGPTPIWDALDEAMALLADAPGKRAIVMYTDGRSTGNTHSLAEVMERATRASISINAVIPPPKIVDQLNPADLLERLAQATGGRKGHGTRLAGVGGAAFLIGQLMDVIR
jgi:Mg-chelatase subunit ChlD